MAVRDIYQLHHPRDTADLTDQFNRLMHRLMARLDGSDSELSATLATLTADLAELLSDFGAHNHALSSDWPIGSVFLAVVATDPAILLGFGTWARIAEGLVLVGYKAGDPDFGTVEGTGGTKTHTLTSDEMPSHTHVQDSHSHGLSDVRESISGSDTTNAQWGTTSKDTSSKKTTIITDSATATNQNTGGGAAHNNLPPFLVLYVWKRTA